MKKVMSLLLILVLVFSLAACGTKAPANDGDDAADGGSTAEDTLIVGTEAGFAPYEYMEGDQIVGIDMDISQAIADSMGKKLEIKNMDFDGALLAVQQGKLDFVAAGVSINEERAKQVDFSNEYVNSTEVVVVNKVNPTVSGGTAEDLKDKVVGVQQGNIADFWVEENTEAREIKRYTKFVQAAEDLANGKIDCIVMDQYPAEDLVGSNDKLMILEGDPLFEDKYAIAVKKGNTELLDQINTVIDQLIADGKIDEFTANHTSK